MLTLAPHHICRILSSQPNLLMDMQVVMKLFLYNSTRPAVTPDLCTCHTLKRPVVNRCEVTSADIPDVDLFAETLF
ncbi:hypothetical protein EB796_007175 [Bugula neritina]|uniref:Uncharacterized protein n=1 Tax=Bugula neritina TaxID=10212 RepID=A0A7J7K7A9_BUGNE|nr:hypothetical protein EB796_007175 [Bugula neritina]